MSTARTRYRPGLGRDRSRRPCAPTCERVARPVRARPRCSRSSRPTATGTARCPSRRAALDAGARALGVALVEEGIELRDAGDRRADPRAVGAGSRRRGQRGRVRPHARRLHTRRHRRARQGGRRPRRARAPRRAPQGRHGHASGRLRPRRRGRARGPSGRPSGAASSPACARISRSPTNPATPTPQEQLARFDGVLGGVARARSPDRHRARVQHGGRDRVAGRALRHGARSGSAATASRPPTRSRDGSRCNPRWP